MHLVVSAVGFDRLLGRAPDRSRLGEHHHLRRLLGMVRDQGGVEDGEMGRSPASSGGF